MIIRGAELEEGLHRVIIRGAELEEGLHSDN